MSRNRGSPEERDALVALAGVDAADGAKDATPDASADAAAAKGPKLSPAERAAWVKAVDKLYEECGKLALKERIQVWLKEDTARLGQVVAGRTERVGEVDVYRQMLDRYNQEWQVAKTDYQFDHQFRVAVVLVVELVIGLGDLPFLIVPVEHLAVDIDFTDPLSSASDH
ncbi:MAG: hypothetical protein NT069_33350, partial [Planctomycetota bacterium]|nr:hypothetical protein [Planctomycetota bacterium]